MTEPAHEGRKRAGRYQRGVSVPPPEVLDRIRGVLADNPTISKSKLAEKVGISRASLYYHLRHLRGGDGVQSVARAFPARSESVTHQMLVDRVAQAADDVRGVIALLKAQPMNPSTASAVFRGYSTATKLWHLLGELLGEISPPDQNVYVSQLSVLLERPVNPVTLSATARNALGLDR